MSRFRLPRPLFHPADAGAVAEALPEWDLSALYASPDDPAIERDEIGRASCRERV